MFCIQQKEGINNIFKKIFSLLQLPFKHSCRNIINASSLYYSTCDEHNFHHGAGGPVWKTLGGRVRFTHVHVPDYARWLQLEHPDAVPRNYSQLISEESLSPAILTLSVSDKFNDVVPLESVSQLTTLPSTSSVVKLTSTPTSSASKNGSHSLAPLTIKKFYNAPATNENGSHPTTPSSTTPSVVEGRCNASPSTSRSGNCPLIPSTSGLQEVPSTPSTSSRSYTTPLASPLTSYLIKPVIPEHKALQGAVGARVLTSEDSLKLVEEKALKKQKELEEKEQRKIENGKSKRKLKICNKSWGTEEAAWQQKKQHEETRKQSQQKQRQGAQEVEIANSNPVGGLDHFQEPGFQDQPRNKWARITEDTVINTNTCCICFETYEVHVNEENGREWMECSCGQWLHEDCYFMEPPMPNEFCLYCVR